MQKGKEIGKHYENLSKLLKKTKITTKSVNDVLEKIPSDLLPDVLKRKVGGCQFLHWAADDKHGGVFLEAVAGKLTEEQLLGLLKAEDNEQKTPLHWAAGSENGGAFLKAVAKRLSEEKLLEVLKMPSKSGEMFLRTVFNGPNPIGFLKAVAAKLTEEQLLGLLEIKDDGQKTPLHWVAWSKHGGVFLEAVAGKLTEEQLLGFLKAGDNGKKTPLHLAAGSWNEGGGAFLEAVAAKLTEEQLLGLLKAEDNEQKTPLHWAAWSKHGGVFLEAVVGKLTEEQLLGFLKAGDNGKKTPLHLAAGSWNEGGGAFLEAAAAKLTEEQLLSLLEAGDNEQKTPLHLAAESKHGGAFLEALAKRLSEEKLLKVLKMPYGADEMLLHAVLKGPNMGGFLKAVARKLPKDQLIGLIKGAVGSRDEGVSLLLALNRVLSKEQLMEYLEIPDSSGFAPLHSAAQSGNKKFLDTVFAILKKYPEETIALFETQANGQKLIEIANETVKQDLEKALVEAQKYKEKRELVHAMFMNAFEEIKKVPGFQSCTLKQQAYIQTYAQQMIEGGDKAEFAIAVCANMVKLYQAKIDEKLPAKITKPERNSDGSFKLTQTIEAEAKAMETAVNELSQIMRKSGGDYRIMKDFLEKQIGSSECRQSQAMRYHWLTQRQNPEESSLWGREMPAWYRGLNKEDRKQARAPLNHTQRANLKKGIYPEWVNKLDGEDRKAAIKVMGRELFDEFPAYEIRNSGPAKTFSLEEMKAKFEKVCEKFYGGNQEKYAKTVAMHKAFVAVALDKIDFPGKNPETSTCTIDRVVNFERVSQTQSDYAQQRMQGTATIAHQIAESAAIGGPIEWCVGPGTDTHHFEVPVARIMVPYCCHLFKENSGGSSVNFWCEREFMCNFNGLSAEIVQN
ncbi:MAG: hypothetical protein LBF34_03395 [Puniceicoccales bacterium]|jgi:ankyrin repeat protein|nr:hypothetical protein [Puniceicoccales bacterium]